MIKMSIKKRYMKLAILQLNAFGAWGRAHCPPNNFATKSNIWNCIFKISKAKDYTMQKGQHEHNWCHEEINVIKKLGLTCQNCLFILKVETVEILLLSNNMLWQFSLLEYVSLILKPDFTSLWNGWKCIY